VSVGERGTRGFRWTRAGAATVVGVSNTSRAACPSVLIDTEKESIPDWRRGNIRSGLLGKWSGARATHRAGHAVERDSFDVDR
jgi:hypothetical protein